MNDNDDGLDAFLGILIGLPLSVLVWLGLVWILDVIGVL
jgi:hypothetical protein